MKGPTGLTFFYRAESTVGLAVGISAKMRYLIAFGTSFVGVLNIKFEMEVLLKFSYQFLPSLFEVGA